MSAIYTVGLPPDAVAWAALVLAIVTWCAWPWTRRWVLGHTTAVAIIVAVSAGLLSLVYVHVYLRGGPRIIDATSYFLEARLLAQGAFAFDPLVPTSSFRGRFLTGPEDGSSLSVIFPPGYPLILALGFWIEQPLLIGPLIGAGLVLVSYQLGWCLFRQKSIALTAAGLSATCAALRYHTADTMSHGWAALLFGGCILLLCQTSRRATVAAGLCAGWLIATRPVTGILCVALSLYWLKALRPSGWFLAALTPGLGLLGLHQHAATGAWFSSSQTHYYAHADGPPGCFRYGFGSGIGCVHEHGDVVAESLMGGFGPLQAAITSFHRLAWHALDVANLELLWLVLPFAAIVGFKQREVRLLALASVGIIFAYAPFYFNGSYPGAGARFFADVLPLEHALLAFGLVRLSQARLAISLALLGFALRGAYAHRDLAARDGGAPMFQPEVALRARIDRGLVLVNTDHGFNLAFDPAQRDARRELVFARERGDARDRLLWEALDQPPLYRYRFHPWSSSPGPTLTPYFFAPRTPTQALTFEAEYEWPVWALSAGSAYPRRAASACASNHRALTLVPASAEPLRVELDLVVPATPRYELVLGWVRSHARTIQAKVRVGGESRSHSVAFEDQACASVPTGFSPPPGNHRISIAVETTPAQLDYVRLMPSSHQRSPRKSDIP